MHLRITTGLKIFIGKKILELKNTEKARKDSMLKVKTFWLSCNNCDFGANTWNAI